MDRIQADVALNSPVGARVFELLLGPIVKRTHFEQLRTIDAAKQVLGVPIAEFLAAFGRVESRLSRSAAKPLQSLAIVPVVRDRREFRSFIPRRCHGRFMRRETLNFPGHLPRYDRYNLECCSWKEVGRRVNYSPAQRGR